MGCSLSYHIFTTQRKPTSRGLVQYNILYIDNNNEIIAALSEAYSFLTFSLSFLPGPSDSDSVGYLYVATDSCNKGRILEGQRFILAGGFEDLNILNEKSINFLTPVIDR